VFLKIKLHIYYLWRLVSYSPKSVIGKPFRTLVTLHLLQSHCTRGLQYPKQSDRVWGLDRPKLDTSDSWAVETRVIRKPMFYQQTPKLWIMASVRLEKITVRDCDISRIKLWALQAWRSRKCLSKLLWRSRKSLHKRGAAGSACTSMAQQEVPAQAWWVVPAQVGNPLSSKLLYSNGKYTT